MFEIESPSNCFRFSFAANNTSEIVQDHRDVLTAEHPTAAMMPAEDFVIGEKNVRSDHDYSNGLMNDYAADAPASQMNGNRTSTMDGHWEALVDSDIPDFTQAHITNVPQIQSLYEAYHIHYTNPTATNATRMMYAKALAFALLKHYYPASQDYMVKPSSLGPTAQYGMSFILEAEDGSDIWRDLPAQRPVEKSKRKNGLVPKQRNAAQIAAEVARYNHGLRYILGIWWDWIGPEDIAGFVVLRKIKTISPKTNVIQYEYRAHTYLAIMMDSFEELPRFSKENTTHRSDVLADALCRQARLQEGYGILLYGPRLEFYNYNAGARWVHYESDDDETDENTASEEEAQDIEPILKSLLSPEGEEMAVDMRSSNLQKVNVAFQRVAAMNVKYVCDT